MPAICSERCPLPSSISHLRPEPGAGPKASGLRAPRLSCAIDLWMPSAHGARIGFDKTQSGQSISEGLTRNNRRRRPGVGQGERRLRFAMALPPPVFAPVRKYRGDGTIFLMGVRAARSRRIRQGAVTSALLRGSSRGEDPFARSDGNQSGVVAVRRPRAEARRRGARSPGDLPPTRRQRARRPRGVRDRPV
jgi:hypothetical protein